MGRTSLAFRPSIWSVVAMHGKSTAFFASGCDGGNPIDAFDYWVRFGLCTGGNYENHRGCKPYPFPPCAHHVNSTLAPCSDPEFNTPQCEEKCQESYKIPYAQDKYFGQEYYVFEDEDNVTAIQMDILKNGPVVATFDVYEDFLSYKEGVYKYTTGKLLGGHAVRVLGWGLYKNELHHEIPYWLVANSWNAGWGDKGYFKILRGKNDCDFEKELATGTPKLK